MDERFGLERENELEDALALLAAGIPLDEVLAETGDDPQWLRPLLEIAGEVGELRQTAPIPSPEASLHRMLSHAKKMTASSPQVTSARSPWPKALSNLFQGGFRLATAAATALLVLFLLGGMLNVAAQQSLPGQPLYWLKHAGETLQLNLTRNPDRREQLTETFNQRRRLEIEQLLTEGQTARVTFEGWVQAVTDKTINLEGLSAQLTPDTQVNGQPASGARVRVEVKTQPPDGLIALSVTVIEAAPSPTPTVMPTLPPTPTLPSVQGTDSLPTLPPTATPVKAQDIDTLPTVTPVPLSTAVPTAIPTAGIDDSADDNVQNDNTNDNFEDNSQGNEDNFNNDDGDFGDDNFNEGDFNGDDGSGNTDNNNSGDNSDDNSNEGDDHSGPGGGGSDDPSGPDGGGGDDSGDSDHSNSDDGGSDDSGDSDHSDSDDGGE